ncbi:MAG: decarboxylating 6-phosphogluconate dehydrogenase [Sinimarinibacterium sp.]|jgi:6-phosphogluconate dehydrogenase
MQIGFVGLGRMGANMVERLLRGGHEVIVYNRSPERTHLVMQKGALGAFSLAELATRLATPRVVWLMVPAGEATETSLRELAAVLAKGDLVVDGGNSNFEDSRRRAGTLDDQGIAFVDAGTSGGIWGLENGYCLMVGGRDEAVQRLAPALTTLAPPDGWLHCGPAGSGHYAKMIHNGIEYGLMQAYAEGFELLRAGPFAFDVSRLAGLWNRGSVIRSWLLELAERALARDPNLSSIEGYVADSGEGRWTIEQALRTAVPTPVLAQAVFARFASRQSESFAAKLLSALRQEFGGHPVRTTPVSRKDS